MKRLKIDINVSQNDRRLSTSPWYCFQVIPDVDSLDKRFFSTGKGERECLESADLIQDCLDHSQRLIIIFPPFSKFVRTNLLKKIMDLQQNVTDVEFLKNKPPHQSD